MTKCYFCKAPLQREKIRHFHQWGETAVLFENLEVEKCTQCGEVFLDPKTVELIDRKTEDIKAQNGSFRSISIPVVALTP